MQTTSLASLLRLTIGRTNRRLRQEGGGELPSSQYSALVSVDRHGPLTPSELAAHERIQRPTATRVSPSSRTPACCSAPPTPATGAAP